MDSSWAHFDVRSSVNVSIGCRCRRVSVLVDRAPGSVGKVLDELYVLNNEISLSNENYSVE